MYDSKLVAVCLSEYQATKQQQQHKSKNVNKLTLYICLNWRVFKFPEISFAFWIVQEAKDKWIPTKSCQRVSSNLRQRQVMRADRVKCKCSQDSESGVSADLCLLFHLCPTLIYGSMIPREGIFGRREGINNFYLTLLPSSWIETPNLNGRI